MAVDPAGLREGDRTYLGRPVPLSRIWGLRKPQGDLTAAQESAEGIVGHGVGKANEALQAERWSNGQAEPGTMAEGPNDWEW